MIITRYDQETPEGLVKCVYVDTNNFRILFAYSQDNWYTKDVKRLIPIYIKNKALFIYRLAIRAGRRVDNI